MEDVNVQLIVDVDADDKAGIPAFRDAIYLPLAEYQTLTAKQIDKLKQQRYLAWRKVIENPEPAPEPEPVADADRVAQLSQLIADLAQITEQVQGMVAQTQQEPTPAGA